MNPAAGALPPLPPSVAQPLAEAWAALEHVTPTDAACRRELQHATDALLRAADAATTRDVKAAVLLSGSYAMHTRLRDVSRDAAPPSLHDDVAAATRTLMERVPPGMVRADVREAFAAAGIDVTADHPWRRLAAKLSRALDLLPIGLVTWRYLGAVRVGMRDVLAAQLRADLPACLEAERGALEATLAPRVGDRLARRVVGAALDHVAARLARFDRVALVTGSLAALPEAAAEAAFPARPPARDCLAAALKRVLLPHAQKVRGAEAAFQQAVNGVATRHGIDLSIPAQHEGMRPALELHAHWGALFNDTTTTHLRAWRDELHLLLPSSARHATHRDAEVMRRLDTCGAAVAARLRDYLRELEAELTAARLAWQRDKHPELLAAMDPRVTQAVLLISAEHRMEAAMHTMLRHPNAAPPPRQSITAAIQGLLN
jgi:hypothetical protein